MTDIAPRPRTTLLPLAAGSATGSWQTCRYKCGFDCWHEPTNTSDNETFDEVVQRALSRRDFLRGVVVVSAAAGLSTVGARSATATTAEAPTAAATDAAGAAAAEGSAGGSGLMFSPIAPSGADQLIVPDGYTSEVVLRWGDPVLRGAANFDFANQTPDAQAGQFGYNNDFVAFMPLPRPRAGDRARSDRGLLWVNHEYVNPQIMFPDWDPDAPTEQQVTIIMHAVGGTVAELRRGRNRLFSFRDRSRYNRRITLFTPMRIGGPAAGHPLLRTSADPDGTTVLGTVGNCAGGRTPWGTILTAEENFQSWFANADEVDFDRVDEGAVVKALIDRYGINGGATEEGLERYYDRFDLTKELNENHRFGYVVEVDPYRPRSTPTKRTALGRFRHEGATSSVTTDGRVAFYMGDDQAFDYVYKFVTAGTYDPQRRRRNANLLDDGTLYVAKFDVADDGSRVGTWIPLVAGQGPLTADAGFPTQAEVCVGTRLAADLVGATKMDRPEDVQRNEVNGGVYIALTKNADRGTTDDNDTSDPNDDTFAPQEDSANPRANNAGGHVIELFEDDGDAGATSFTWSLFLVCGNPDDPSTYFAGFPKDQVSPIGNPDNVAFDRLGNLIIATDGQPGSIGVNDAFHFVPVDGDQRGHVQQFLSVPVDAEACGPELTPDNRTLFCAVQHPGEDGTVDSPTSTWPDGQAPPRPSVVDIAKTRGRGRIGT